MKKIFVFFIVLIYCGTLYAQSPQFAWAKSIGGDGNDNLFAVAIDNNNNFYLAGSFEGLIDFDPELGIYNKQANGNTDAFVAKYNSFGNIIWVQSFGGSQFDSADGIALDQAGNICVTGKFAQSVDFDPGTDEFNLTASGAENSSDVYLLKLDPSGNFIFAKKWGGEYPEFPNDLEVDNAGNIYTIGCFRITANFGQIDGIEQNVISNGNSDMFICKTNSDGNLLWVKSFGGPASDSEDNASIAIDSEGNVITTGYYSETVDFDPGGGTYTLTNTGNNVTAEIFIEKLDSEGNFVWARSIGSSGTDSGNSIEIDLNDNILIAGNFQFDVDFDPGPETFMLSSFPGYSPFVLKLDNSANFIWASAVTGGNSSGVALDITTDESGNVYSTGFFADTKDFDPGDEVYNLTVEGLMDIYISKLNEDGNFLWAKSLGGYSAEVGKRILTDTDQNIYTFGLFDAFGNYNSDDGPNVDLYDNGGSDIFIQKMGTNIVQINELLGEESVLMYPNPTKYTLHLITPTSEELMLLEILTPLGQVVYTRPLYTTNGIIEVDTSELQQGIYYAKTYAKSGLRTITKFMKE
jgi:hypothetical protein